MRPASGTWISGGVVHASCATGCPEPADAAVELKMWDSVTVARTWTFPAGSVVVADRAYLDFGWLHRLQEQGVTFVTRLKRGVKYRVLRDHDVAIQTGVLSDQTIDRAAFPCWRDVLRRCLPPPRAAPPRPACKKRRCQRAGSWCVHASWAHSR